MATIKLKRMKASWASFIVGVAAFMVVAALNDRVWAKIYPENRESNLVALCVGVDEYQDKRLPKLLFCADDAKKMVDVLRDVGAREKACFALTNRGATNVEIRQEIDAILDDAGPESTVVILLAGNGFETKDGEVWFCPSDFDADNWEETAISIGELRDRLIDDDARFKLLIVDACRELSPFETKYQRRALSRATRAIKPKSSFALLFSCQSLGRAYEDQTLDGGVFTHFIAETLRERRGGGLRVSGLWRAASQKTRDWTKKGGFVKEQIPTCDIEGVDFFIGYEPSPSDK